MLKIKRAFLELARLPTQARSLGPTRSSTTMTAPITMAKPKAPSSAFVRAFPAKSKSSARPELNEADLLWTLCKHLRLDQATRASWIDKMLAAQKMCEHENMSEVYTVLEQFYQLHRPDSELRSLQRAIDQNLSGEAFFAAVGVHRIERRKPEKLYCPHGKTKRKCRACGGSGICPHNLFKEQCRECRPNNFCEHGSRRNMCRLCCGGFICVHQREKNKCVECQGTGTCEHGRVRRMCKECKGLVFVSIIESECVVGTVAIFDLASMEK